MSKITDFLNNINSKTSKTIVKLSNGKSIEAHTPPSNIINNIVKIIFTDNKKNVASQYEDALDKLLVTVYGKEVYDAPYHDKIRLVFIARCIAIGNDYVHRVNGEDGEKENQDFDITDNFNKAVEFEVPFNDKPIEYNNLFGANIKWNGNLTIKEAQEINSKYSDKIKKIKGTENQLFTQQNIEIIKRVDTITLSFEGESKSISFNEIPSNECFEIVDTLPSTIISLIVDHINDNNRDDEYLKLDQSTSISIDPLFFSKR